MRLFNKERELARVFRDYRVEFALNINIAFFLQQERREESQSNVEHIKAAVKALKRASKNLPANEESLFEKIKFEFTLIKSYLQLAVAHSQRGSHKEALGSGRKCLFYFTSLVHNVRNLFIEEPRNVSERVRTAREADPELTDRFKHTLSDVLQISNFVERILLHKEQNDLTFLQSLDLTELDNLPIGSQGKAKLNPPWLENVSVANFMHVEYVPLSKIGHTISFGEVFTEAFLSLLLMLAGTVYFVVSTENRFLCLEGETLSKIKPVFEKTQLQKLRKEKTFMFRLINK